MLSVKIDPAHRRVLKPATRKPVVGDFIRILIPAEPPDGCCDHGHRFVVQKDDEIFLCNGKWWCTSHGFNVSGEVTHIGET